MADQEIVTATFCIKGVPYEVNWPGVDMGLIHQICYVLDRVGAPEDVLYDIYFNLADFRRINIWITNYHWLLKGRPFSALDKRYILIVIDGRELKLKTP